MINRSLKDCDKTNNLQKRRFEKKISENGDKY